MFPQPQRRLPDDIHSSVQHHLASGHVGDEARGVASELEPVESNRKAEHLAGTGGLVASLHLPRPKQAAVVEDEHGARGILNGDNVGVDGVDGEDKLDVEAGEVEFKGGDVY